MSHDFYAAYAQFLPFRYDMFVKKIDYKTYKLFDNIRLIYTLSINRKNKKEERKKESCENNIINIHLVKLSGNNYARDREVISPDIYVAAV